MPRLTEADLEEVKEGTTAFLAPKSTHEKGPKAKEGVPFYNPDMRLARDISIAVLTALAKDAKPPITVADCMSSLGARGLRIAHEVPSTHVTLNDVNLDAIHLAKTNADRLELKNYDWRMGRLETLLADHRFDWVDLDPFGTPAHWLDLAVESVNDGGVLAVTATDKAALCGAYPDVCERRYNAKPLHNELMWEVAARVLVGGVARAAGRRDRSIEPLLTHSTNHYVRTYVRVHVGADAANKQSTAYACAWIGDDLARHFEPRPPAEGKYGGPMWSGRLQDRKLLDAMLEGKPKGIAKDTVRRLETLRDEADAPPLYYTVDEFTRELKSNAPKLETILDRLRKAGHAATRTHFTPRGFKTDAPPKAVRAALA